MNVSLTFEPIGRISSDYLELYEAPSQPGLEPVEADAQVVLRAGENWEQALRDLIGFEKIWLLSWLNRNKNWKPMVLPPRGSKQKRGVFATRSPHRPNPIGLTLTDLKSIEGRILHVGPVDLLHDTPILDIKPYLPYTEAHPQAKAGWIESAFSEDLNSAYSVSWSQQASEQEAFLRNQFGMTMRDLAERVLRLDPHPHPYRRVSVLADGTRQLALKSWRLIFSLRHSRVCIERVQSGYTLEQLEQTKSSEAFHQYSAHREFHRRWPE